MNIHEYQAKSIFSKYGIPITRENVAHHTKQAVAIASDLGFPVVVKAQVHVGGRGKAGGIKKANNLQELVPICDALLGVELKGCTVEKVLVAECVPFSSEYYLGVTIDRNSKSVMVIVSAEGGVDIEEVAANNPNAIHRLSIDPYLGLTPFMARKMALKLHSETHFVQQTTSVLLKLYRLLMDTDAAMIEINPLVVTTDGTILALDGKMSFDENALFRQPSIQAFHEPNEEEKKELYAKSKGLSYIRLHGSIGCMVNGAGLAMATMDIIKYYGGQPANFLDIGGSSNPQKVIDAMNILLSEPQVKVILINIFGGITRCDDVARGLIQALQQIECTLPMVVRLAGTHAQEGIAMLQAANIPVVHSMNEAAQQAVTLCNSLLNPQTLNHDEHINS